MILDNKSNSSKKKLCDYIRDIGNFFFPASKLNIAPLFQVQEDTPLNVLLVEWNEKDLVENESALRRSYFPINIKIFLNNGLVIYIISKYFLCSGNPPPFEGKMIKTVDSLDYVIKNTIEKDQIIRLKFNKDQDLFFVSEEFYLSNLETN